MAKAKAVISKDGHTMRKWRLKYPERAAAYRKAYYAKNRERVIAKTKAWHDANRDKRACYHRERRHGIKNEAFLALMAKQDNKCAICKIPIPLFGRNNCVDHCHLTGVIRGILCNRCNKGIGNFKDDPKIMSVAIEYLANFEAQRG